MNLSRILATTRFLSACFVVGLASTLAAHGADLSGKPSGLGKAPELKPIRPFGPGTIAAVDVASHTVTVQREKDSTMYDVDDLTWIVVNGKSNKKLDDIKVGMTVLLSPGTDGKKAVRIVADDPPPPKKPRPGSPVTADGGIDTRNRKAP